LLRSRSIGPDKKDEVNPEADVDNAPNQISSDIRKPRKQRQNKGFKRWLKVVDIGAASAQQYLLGSRLLTQVVKRCAHAMTHHPTGRI
jgi:hypothetical protein